METKTQIQNSSFLLDFLTFAAALRLLLRETPSISARISDWTSLPAAESGFLYDLALLFSIILGAWAIAKYPALRKAALALCVLVFAAIILDIAAKTVLRRDDHWEIYEARQRGMFGFLRFMFLEKTGRFSASFLKSLAAYGSGLLWIRLSIFACAVVIFKASYDLSKKIVSDVDLALQLALVLFSGAYLIQTKIWESIFWGAGSHIYIWGFALAIVAVNRFYDAYLAYAPRKVVLACLGAFVACGFAELVNLSLISIFGVVLISLMLNPKRDRQTAQRRRLTLIFLITLMTGTLLSFAMPGNYSRASEYAASANSVAALPFLDRAANAIRMSNHGLVGHFGLNLGLFTLFGLMTFFVGCQNYIDHEPAAPAVFVNPKAAAFAAGLLLLTAYVSLILNGYIGYIPSRVYIIPLILVFLAVSLFSYSIGLRIGKRFPMMRENPLRVSVIAFTVALLWLDFYVNARPQLNYIYRTWTERDRALTELASDPSAANLESVETCAVELIGTNLYDIEPGEMNSMIGRYYGLPPLTADEPCH